MLFVNLRKKSYACISVGLAACAELGYTNKYVNI